jgi:hypothetical protein
VLDLTVLFLAIALCLLAAPCVVAAHAMRQRASPRRFNLSWMDYLEDSLPDSR